MLISFGVHPSGGGHFSPAFGGNAANNKYPLDVQCVFSADALTEVTYKVTDSTNSDYFQNRGEDAKKLCSDIVAAQSVEVDGMSGATLSSKAICKGVEDCMNQAKGLVSAEPQIVEKIVYMDDNAWLGEEPETPASFKEELNVDVAVIGSGYAGIAAMRMAVEEGASVVVLEKGGSIGMPSTAMAVIGSRRWAQMWPDEAEKFFGLKEFLVSKTSAMCLNRNNYEILKRWVDENGECVDWWLSAVPEDQVSWGTQKNGNKYDNDAEYIIYNDCYPYSDSFDPTKEDWPCIPCSMQQAPAGAWQKANVAKAQEVGGDRLRILTYTPAYKLLREKGGRVTGVIGKTQEGDFIKVNVNKGVVLATGGFMANEAMVRHFLPEVYNSGYDSEKLYYSVRDAEDKRCNTGDGHRLGLWIGGKMQTYGATMSHLVGVNKTIGTMPLLWLDKRGRRFLNEDTQGQQFAEIIRQQPGRMAYQLLDSTYDDHWEDLPVGHGKTTGVKLAGVDEKVDGEKIFKGDTLEALLAQLDIDAEKAMASIQHYNELCKAGRDTDFGKNPKYMFGLEKGPFYAIKYGRGDDLVTVSGLESDGDCHVLDEDFQVIPGLYVAGNVQGGRFACIYPETMRGLSVATATTMGRVAGRNAARGI